MEEELLTDDGDFTPQLEKALLEIFHRHDRDKDSFLNDYELNEFAKMCNGGEGFDELAMEEIKDNFEVSEEGYLTENGFLAMYSLQTNASPEETWKDLKNHGYDDKLNLKVCDECVILCVCFVLQCDLFVIVVWFVVC
jgi:Ca2+-binding EF-hand superfamily protein